MKRNSIYILVFCIVLFLGRHTTVSRKKTYTYMPHFKSLLVETGRDSIKIFPVLRTGIDSDAWIMYRKGEDYYTRNLLGEDIVMSTSKEIDTTFHHEGFRYVCRVVIKKEGQLYSTSVYGTFIYPYLLMKLTYDKNYNIKSINPGLENRVSKYE